MLRNRGSVMKYIIVLCLIVSCLAYVRLLHNECKAESDGLPYIRITFDVVENGYGERDDVRIIANETLETLNETL